jgi:hypothetical protein
VAEAALPLTPGAILRWLSLTDCFTPVTLDSAGVLRIWSAAYGGSWTPALDKQSSGEENFWPVAVAGGALRYVACGAGSYPEVRCC